MVAVRPGQSHLSQAGLGAGSPGVSRRYWRQNSRANRRSRTKAGARDFLISGPFCAILRHLGLLALRLGSGQAPSTPRCSVQGDPSTRLRAGSFDSAQGRLLRLGSGQAPSTRLRAGSFDSAQGRLLRLGSGQAPSTRLRAGSFDSAQGRLLRLGSGQAPSTRLRAGSFDPALLRTGRPFDSAQGRLLRLGSGRTEAGCSGLVLILIIVVRCIPGWEGRGVSRRVNAEGAENAEFFDGLGSL